VELTAIIVLAYVARRPSGLRQDLIGPQRILRQLLSRRTPLLSSSRTYLCSCLSEERHIRELLRSLLFKRPLVLRRGRRTDTMLRAISYHCVRIYHGVVLSRIHRASKRRCCRGYITVSKPCQNLSAKPSSKRSIQPVRPVDDPINSSRWVDYTTSTPILSQETASA
jgi:hypothetical protein